MSDSDTGELGRKPGRLPSWVAPAVFTALSGSALSLGAWTARELVGLRVDVERMRVEVGSLEKDVGGKASAIELADVRQRIERIDNKLERIDDKLDRALAGRRP